jgi:sulfide:quinone oxidoreductase
MPPITYITPGFAIAPELTAADFQRLAEFGFRSVISNRPDGEAADQLAGREEALLARRAGLDFRHVPAAKHELFTDEVVGAMTRALAELPGPVLAHCKSGIRAAIAWAAASAHRMPVAEVLGRLAAAGQDLEFLRDDLEAQADRGRWTAGEAAGDSLPGALAAAA